MSNKDRSLLLEFLIWLSSDKHMDVDYQETINKFEACKELCNIMCNEKARD